MKTFTHKIVSSGQKCFPACWWPSEDPKAGTHEKEYPLMMFESGQCNRVKKSNLKPILK
jgi:hypothetical protein